MEGGTGAERACQDLRGDDVAGRLERGSGGGRQECPPFNGDGGGDLVRGRRPRVRDLGRQGLTDVSVEEGAKPQGQWPGRVRSRGGPRAAGDNVRRDEAGFRRVYGECVDQILQGVAVKATA